MRLSFRLRIIPGLRWMVDGPAWVRRLMGFIVTPFLLFLIAVLVEGRVPSIQHQYKGLIPGDLFLALAWWVAIELCAAFLPAPSGKWYQTRAFQAVKVGMGVFMLLLLTVPEMRTTAMHYGQPGVLTWAEVFSPTKLYHTIILVVYGYMMTAVVLPALVSVPWRTWYLLLAKVMIVVFIGCWAYGAFYYDNTHPRPDKKYIHVGNGWPWQRHHWWQGTPR